MKRFPLLLSFCLLLSCVGSLPAQEITVGVPIHPRNYWDSHLPLQTWECSSTQLGLSNQLEFRDVDGAVTTYVDCHGVLHGGGGGTCPAGTLGSVQFNHPLGTCDGTSKFTADDAGAVNINGGGTLTIEAPLSPSNNFTKGTGSTVQLTADGSNDSQLSGIEDGFAVGISDVGTPPFTNPGPLAVTNVALASDVLTVTVDTIDPADYRPGMFMIFSGLTGAAFLNGQIVELLNANMAGFTGIFSAADYPSAADSGTAVVQSSNFPVSYYVGCAVNLPGGTCTGFSSDLGVNSIPNGYAAKSLVDFMAGPLSDGPDFGYGFDAGEHEYTNMEGAEFLAEGEGEYVSPHEYAFKSGDSGLTPFWWTYPSGDNYTRAGYNVVTQTTVGACALSTGLSDCTASLGGSGGPAGPPASETITIMICATGPTYDSFDYAWDGLTPTCQSNHVQEITSPYPESVGDDVMVTFASNTGHTAGATAAIPVVVTVGTQIEALGGSYFSSTPLATPAAPTVTPSTAGTSSWSYCTIARFNGVPTDCSPTGGDTSGPATLDVGDYETIATGLPIAGATDCIEYRTATGTSPSTIGALLDGSGNIISFPCGTSIVDNGLAADGISPNDRNLTGSLMPGPLGISAPMGPFFDRLSFYTYNQGFLFTDNGTDSGTTSSGFNAGVGTGGFTFTSEAGGFVFTDNSNYPMILQAVPLILGGFTIAQLAALSSPQPTELAWATDALGPTDCTVGLSTGHAALCAYNGSAWVAIGGY